MSFGLVFLLCVCLFVFSPDLWKTLTLYLHLIEKKLEMVTYLAPKWKEIFFKNYLSK